MNLETVTLPEYLLGFSYEVKRTFFIPTYSAYIYYMCLLYIYYTHKYRNCCIIFFLTVLCKRKAWQCPKFSYFHPFPGGLSTARQV